MEAVGAWALDFVRAMNKRPWIIKILCRAFMGKYAYREFIGMIWGINKIGYFPFFDYGLEECGYNQEKHSIHWWE
jgi:hypothetical protein